MLSRNDHAEAVRVALGRNPVVALLGARQVGKTTLARALAADWQAPVTFLDLESPRDRSRLADPLLALEGLTGLVVLDEVQRVPDLFPVLRVLADRPGPPARFLVLGSASPDLLRQSSESLAGRIAFHTLPGFSLDEVGVAQSDRLWIRGGFPRSFLAETESASVAWRAGFVRTFLERDLPSLGSRVPAETLHRFWTMLAHSHGQTWNGAELGRAFGVAHTTVRRYLDLLTDALVVRQLQPWHANLRKRQVKSPKVYLSDPGLLHTLLGLETPDEVLGHPKVGASWEGFAIAEVARVLRAEPRECYFWATHAGAELDLLVVRGPERRGFEIKRTSTPRRTHSMTVAMDTLDLDRLDVIVPGSEVFPIAENIRAVGLQRLDVLDPVR